MTGADKAFAAILETVAHGRILPKQIVLETTQFEIFEFDKMRNDIETGKKSAAICTKADDPELYKMITKSLAVLTKFPHGKEAELVKYCGHPISALEQCLEKLWGKPITEPEYNAILNQ